MALVRIFGIRGVGFHFNDLRLGVFDGRSVFYRIELVKNVTRLYKLAVVETDLKNFTGNLRDYIDFRYSDHSSRV